MVSLPDLGRTDRRDLDGFASWGAVWKGKVGPHPASAVAVRVAGGWNRSALLRVMSLYSHERTDPVIRTLALFALIALTACETVEGAGRDLTTAGEVITEEAKDASY